MKRKPYREHHLLCALQAFDAVKLPMDLFLSQYFREHKAVGSKDRKFIADTAYQLMRWRALYDFNEKKPTWETRFQKFSNGFTAPDAPLHIRVSFPKWYYEKIENDYPGKAQKICLLLNEQAPTTIRVNEKLISRNALLKKWKDTYQTSPTKESPFGITFHKKINFFASTEFKAGYFEVQDEGSQLLSMKIAAKPQELILDYCAGSGGKTLGFAPHMQGKGQVFLHDIRAHALREAKKRLKRAHIQNAQILLSTSKQKKSLYGKMDKVLLDVPCSGSGTLRRNPDMKWKSTPEDFKELIQLQREIFEEALPFVKKGGLIFYSTCSLFLEENEKQIEYFTKHFDVSLLSQEGWLPISKGKDGFFIAVLSRQ